MTRQSEGRRGAESLLRCSLGCSPPAFPRRPPAFRSWKYPLRDRAARRLHCQLHLSMARAQSPGLAFIAQARWHRRWRRVQHCADRRRFRQLVVLPACLCHLPHTKAW